MTTFFENESSQFLFSLMSFNCYQSYYSIFFSIRENRTDTLGKT